jgi:multidrug resistance efflux pump
MIIDKKTILTGMVVVVAVVAVLLVNQERLENPWTRDGQVRAVVIQITPRVSGPIVKLAVKANQFVKAGDLLFEIDPRTFSASLAQAKAQYDKTGDTHLAQEKQVEVAEASVTQAESGIKEIESQIEQDKAEYARQQELLPSRATSQKAVERAKARYKVSVEQRTGAVGALAQARASLAEARANLGALGVANASIREAQASVRQAELDLEFTQVKAPVDGYVANLNLRLGSHAVANQPVLALVDVNSYWIHGFFKENTIKNIRKGNQARVTLMTHPDQPLDGVVDSLGWGIAQEDGSTGFELLPNVSPTFEWIRLAQRIPVRIHLNAIPEGIQLRVGTTASVQVRTGTADSSVRE